MDDATNTEAPFITITDWWTSYENNRTRELERISWYSAPSRCDSDSYLDITERGKVGFVTLGVFTGLCRAMAGMPKAIRKTGTFTKDNGEPMPALRICHLANVPPDIFGECLPIMVSAGLVTISGQAQTDPAPTSHQHRTDPAPTSATDRRGKDKDGKGKEKGGGAAPNSWVNEISDDLKL